MRRVYGVVFTVSVVVLAIVLGFQTGHAEPGPVFSMAAANVVSCSTNGGGSIELTWTNNNNGGNTLTIYRSGAMNSAPPANLDPSTVQWATLKSFSGNSPVLSPKAQGAYFDQSVGPNGFVVGKHYWYFLDETHNGNVNDSIAIVDVVFTSGDGCVATTTTVLTPASAAAGASLVTLHAAVTSANPVTIGTVSFEVWDNSTHPTATLIGTATGNVDATGHATADVAVSPNFTSADLYEGKAFYTDGNNFGPSEGDADIAVGVEATQLIVSPVTVTYGTATMTLTALLSDVTTPSNVPAGQKVAFSVNNTPVCDGIGQPACPTTDGNGQAQLTGVPVPNIPAGDYQQEIYATYAGDTADDPQKWGPAFGFGDLNITAAGTTVTVTGTPNPSTYGQSVTFNFSVAGPQAAATPTGSVIVYDAAAAADCNNLGASVAIGTSVTLDGTGAGSTSTSSLPVGSHSILACYGGDQNYVAAGGSTSQTANAAVLTVTADNQSIAFSSPIPTLTYTITGFVNGETSSVVTGTATINTTATNSSPVGSYPITVAQGTLSATNYTFSVAPGTLTIGQAATTTVLANTNGTAPSSTYGQEVDLSATVTRQDNGNPVTVGTVTFSTSDNVASATVALNGSGVATLNISSLPVIAAPGRIVTATYNPPVNNPATTPPSNFGASSDSFKHYVNAAPLTVTADNQSMTFGNAVPSPLTFTMTGFVLGQDSSALTTQPTCSTTGTSSSNVGPYAITCSGGAAANYSFNYVSGTLTIDQAATKTKLANTNNTFPSSVYGQEVDLSATVTRQDSANPVTVGSVQLSTSDLGNIGSPVALNGSGVATFSSTALPVFASPGRTVTVTYIPPVNSPATTPASNFGASSDSFLHYVTPAPLTVTANNQSMNFGSAVPSLTFAITGFVNSQDSSALTTQPTCSTTGTSSTNIGTYPITCSGAAAANYSFSYVGGTLTINQTATKTVLANTNGTFPSSVYGQPVALSATITRQDNSTPVTVGTVTFSASDLGALATVAVNGSGVAVVSTTALPVIASPGRTVTATYNPPANTPATTPASNFGGSYDSFKHFVTPATLTVTANNQVMSYGGPLPSFTYNLTGFVNGQNASVLTSSPACGTAATVLSAAGQYAITCSGGSAPNYTFSYVGAILTITPYSDVATITITTDKGNVAGVPTVQYSDPVGISVSIPIIGNINPLNSCPAGGTACVQVTIGAQAFNIPLTVSSGYLVGSVSGKQLFDAPGSQPVALVVGGNNLSAVNGSYAIVPAYSPNGAAAAASLSVNVTQEDATVSYTGLNYFTTGSTATSTTVTLTYQLQDASADATQSYYETYPGDISKAKVTLTLTPTGGGSGFSCNPTLTVTGTGTTGLPSTATFGCTFTLSVPTNYTASVTPASGSYYQFFGDTTESITTANGGTGFITGGGYQTQAYLSVANTGIGKYTPSGLFAPAAKTKMNFGFVGKFNKQQSNLQGQANIIVRSQCLPNNVQGVTYTAKPGDDHLCVYQIKSNNPTQMTDTPGSGTTPGYGVYIGGAIVQDVTWPTAQSLGGAGVFTVQMVIYDVAEPGTGKDTFGLQLSDKNGVIWSSNNWTGSKTATSATAPLIQGGNIQVH